MLRCVWVAPRCTPPQIRLKLKTYFIPALLYSSKAFAECNSKANLNTTFNRTVFYLLFLRRFVHVSQYSNHILHAQNCNVKPGKMVLCKLKIRTRLFKANWFYIYYPSLEPTSSKSANLKTFTFLTVSHFLGFLNKLYFNYVCMCVEYIVVLLIYYLHINMYVCICYRYEICYVCK